MALFRGRSPCPSPSNSPDPDELRPGRGPTNKRVVSTPALVRRNASPDRQTSAPPKSGRGLPSLLPRAGRRSRADRGRGRRRIDGATNRGGTVHHAHEAGGRGRRALAARVGLGNMDWTELGESGRERAPRRTPPRSARLRAGRAVYGRARLGNVDLVLVVGGAALRVDGKAGEPAVRRSTRA